VFCIRKGSALDAFELFYEELVSSKASKRIRRLQSTAASAN
jgi:hypothetical protein